MSWNDIGSHWWAMALAAVTGFLGWRVKAAQDSVRLERVREDMQKTDARLAAMEVRLSGIEVKDARIETRLDAIVQMLGEMRGELRGKADKP